MPIPFGLYPGRTLKASFNKETAGFRPSMVPHSYLSNSVLSHNFSFKKMIIELSVFEIIVVHLA